MWGESFISHVSHVCQEADQCAASVDQRVMKQKDTPHHHPELFSPVHPTSAIRSDMYALFDDVQKKWRHLLKILAHLILVTISCVKCTGVSPDFDNCVTCFWNIKTPGGPGTSYRTLSNTATMSALDRVAGWCGWPGLVFPSRGCYDVMRRGGDQPTQTRAQAALNQLLSLGRFHHTRWL